MSDNIDIPVTAGSPDPINRIVDAIDRMHVSLNKLGNTPGLSKFQKEMLELQRVTNSSLQQMQAAITTGFREMAEIAKRGNQKIEADAEASASRKLRQQLAWEAKQVAAANKFHDKQIEIEATAENRRAARLRELMQKRDAELHKMRTKELADAEKHAAMLAAAEARRATGLHASHAGYAAQRLATFGGGGGGGNLAPVMAASIGPIHASRQALISHNAAMYEGHSLARGLAGSLGGLWLTYGSVVPLLAGAAIATSLKSIVTAGKEVEQQLNFVRALTGTGPDLNKFLTITDSTLRSVTEAANAMRMLAQNGLEAHQALHVLPSILKLATVGEMEVGQAALAATGAASAFGLAYTEAGRVADIFSKVAATSNTSVLAITESMKQASTVASLFKVTIEETAGMLGLLAKINITGGAAGTSMTNMLTGLYEPTELGKKALKELGVEIQTSSGALKPFTQLLEELKIKMAGMNDAARVDLLGDIFTVRGVKSALLALDQIDVFKQKTQEAATATGFMNKVVEQLEDSTDGAYKRLAVTAENTFVKAFAEASPYVQRLGLDLAEALREDGPQNGLKNLSTNVARVTVALVENAGAIGVVAAAWLGMRSIAPVVAIIQAATAATTAATVAQAAAAAATEAHNVAMMRGTATAATYTAMIQAQTTATAAGTAAATAWSATLLPVLGALAVALAGGAALWLVFRDNTNDADRSNVQISNSLSVITDALDKEIERLKESNALWDARAGKFRDSKSVTPEALLQAEAQVKKIEKQILDSGGSLSGARGAQFTTTPTGIVARTAGYHELGLALQAADKNLKSLREQSDRFEKEVAPGQALEKLRQQRQQLKTELESFAKQGAQISTTGEYYQPNEGIRGKHKLAGGLVNQLLGGASDDPKKETERLDQIRTSFKMLKDEVNSMQAGRAPKVDTKLVNDQINARVRELDLERQLQQLRSNDQASELRARNARGEIGDLELINEQLESKIELHRQEIATARQQADAVGPDKLARQQSFENKQVIGEAKILTDQQEAQRARLALVKSTQDEMTRYQAQAHRDRAEFDKAAALDFKVNYGDELARAERDIAANTDDSLKMTLLSYRAWLLNIKRETEQAGVFDRLKFEFDELSYAFDQNMQGVDMAQQFGGMEQAAARAEKTLADLIVKQKQLQVEANKPGAKLADIQAARQVGDQVKSMAKELRGVWVGAAQVIGDSLEKAFGRGGRALGDLLTISTQYDASRRQIDADYEASAKTKEDGAVRAHQQQTLQLNTYGQMAQAAAGFFDEGSRGYKTLMTVSRVFHAAETAMTLASLVPKAISAVLNQGSGDPYTAFGRMAAMAAIVAGLGVAVSFKGGSNNVAADRQAAMGAGTTLGDSKAKSASIANSLSVIEKATLEGVDYSAGMLQALRSIESNISGLSSLVVRNLGLDGTDNISSKSNLLSPTASTALSGGGAAVGFMLGGPIGAVAGALFGAVINALSKIKVDLKDQGISLAPTTLGQASQAMTGSAYQDVNVRKSFLGITYSNNNQRDTSPLSFELTNQFAQVVAGLRTGILTAVNVMGEGGEEFIQKLDTLAISIPEISLKGLTGTQIQEKLEQVFGALGDQLAMGATTSQLAQFQKVGEGAFQTLMRLATEYQVLDGLLKQMGTTFGAVGFQSLAARSRLIELAGGLDEFQEQAAFFSKNFLTEAERLAPLKEMVATQLAGFKDSSGGAIDSIEDYAALAKAQQLNTEEGAKTFAMLMQLAPAFHAVTSAATEAAKKIAQEAKSLQDQLDELTMTPAQLQAKERSQLDPANRALYDQVIKAREITEVKDRLVEAYEAEKDAMQQNIDRVDALKESWTKFRTNMLLSDKSPLTPQQRYEEARGQFDATFKKALSGDKAAQEDLESAADKFLEASRVSNASSRQYTVDFYAVRTAMEQAVSWATKEVDVGKASLQALKLQVGKLADIEKATLSVTQAVNRLATLLGPEGEAKAAEGTRAAIELMYRNMLGRAGDKDGVDFWVNAMRSGNVSLTDVINGIKTSPEYKSTGRDEPAYNDPSRSTVEGLYQSLLGRSADSGGASFWLEAMGSRGATIESIQAAILRSEEYAGRAGTVYTGGSSSTSAREMHQTSSEMARMNEMLAKILAEIGAFHTDSNNNSTDGINATYGASMSAADKVAQGLRDAAREAAQAEAKKEKGLV